MLFTFHSLTLLDTQLEKEWRNFFFGQSYTLSDYFGRYLLAEKQWTIEDQMDELPCKLRDGKTGCTLKISFCFSRDGRRNNQPCQNAILRCTFADVGHW
jgi:hypothetical protein